MHQEFVTQNCETEITRKWFCAFVISQFYRLSTSYLALLYSSIKYQILVFSSLLSKRLPRIPLNPHERTSIQSFHLLRLSELKYFMRSLEKKNMLPSRESLPIPRLCYIFILEKCSKTAYALETRIIYFFDVLRESNTLPACSVYPNLQMAQKLLSGINLKHVAFHYCCGT